MTLDAKITVGRITKAQGLRGEVRVSLLGGSPEIFNLLERMTAVRPEAKPVLLSPESVQDRGRFLVVRFAEIENRSQAESMVGWDLEVAESELPELGAGEYYIHQLEGLEVFTDLGERLGTLEEVRDLPAHDVYVVRNGNREVMLPATDEVVREVDLDRGRMIVHLLDGLVDEPE